MATKFTAPRRRKTLPYPSPPSSIDSVSSCSSFSSQESLSSPSSSPTEPTFAKHFSHEPEIKNALDYSIPPPTAQFFHTERVSKPRKKFTKKEEWKLWYSANFGTNLLEPWENILLHLLFISILILTYVALSRLLKFSTLARIGGRMRFYATGGIVEKSSLL
ncbi:hypothetical protein JCM3765_001402 [Sporobolomyces pararoseus]